MKYKLILPLLLIVQFSFCQKIKWHEGKIKFTDGKSQSGLIAYYSEFMEGLVRIKYDGMIKTYSSKEIDMFFYFDELQNMRRVFYSLPVDINNEDKIRYMFFEVLCETENLFALQREIISRNSDTFPFTPSIEEHYIMYKENNRLKRIPSKVNHKSFPPEHKKLVKYYIKETSFDESDPCQQLDLLEYYLLNTRSYNF